MTHTIPELVDIPATGDGPASVHLFDKASAWAVLAALAANRPLLVRGEPGVGKSQLARAAAVWLKRPILSIVVDSRTESHDLLASFDAVQRLARAQIGSAIRDENTESLLAVENFLHPGKLWWAFDWVGAEKQARVAKAPVPICPPGSDPSNGCVVLIDEIDKAESDLPNGLLEALGSGSFPVRGREAPVEVVGPHPLVVVTTNEDRVLPNAFLRRCLVLYIELPPDGDELKQHLVQRGRAHFQGMSTDLLERVAEMLVEERKEARARHIRPLPGQAEYLDLLRAVDRLSVARSLDPAAVLDEVSGFVLKKNLGAPI